MGMSLSTPLLAAAPLVAGLLGPALVGATSEPRTNSAVVHAVPRAVPSTVPETEAPGEVVEHVAAREPADHLRVLNYWTPDRMAKALPIDLLGLVTRGGGLLGGVTGGGSGVGLAPDVTGGAVKALPPRRTTRPPQQATRPCQETARPSRQSARAQARRRSARPLATTSGSRWAIGGAVAKATGRVFLTMNGVDFVCSASTVRSRNRDLVITAGHCVKDGAGAWAKNWTFVPGYGTAGTKPYGRWTARRMFVAAPWSRSSDDSHDVGMVALAPLRGKHVADVVGVQDIAFNSPRGGRAVTFGYPADPPYDGKHLVYCAGKLRDDPYGDTHDQGLGCDMTAGSSGGPWLSRFDAATGRGTITSVSSFKYSDDRATMYGPILGEPARKLYQTASRA
jgi:V8-like Glu-specific endopeptidase